MLRNLAASALAALTEHCAHDLVRAAQLRSLQSGMHPGVRGLAAEYLDSIPPTVEMLARESLAELRRDRLSEMPLEQTPVVPMSTGLGVYNPYTDTYS